MYYIICEGAVGKAEYIFNKAVIDLYSGSHKYKLLSASGYDNIFKIESDLAVNSLKYGDTLILLFDNVGADMDCGHNMGIAEMLEYICEDCDEIGVTLKYTTYYCFEEMLLSYTRLPDMLLNVDSSIIQSFVNFQKFLLTCSSSDYIYAVFYSDRFKPLLKLQGYHDAIKSHKSREEISSKLLQCITFKMLHTWRVNKSVIGKCWLSDCDNDGYMKYLCEKCKYALKGCSFKEKVEDLDANSISSSGDPYSTMFE